MADDFDVEAYLEEQVNKSKDKKDEKLDSKGEKEKRERDNSKDRDRGRDRDRRRKRSASRSPDSRSRRRDRKDRDSRRDSRDRSSRDRGERRRDKDREVDKEKEKEREERRKKEREEEEKRRRERSAERKKEREELRKQREIDDLTKDQRTIFVSQLTKKVTERNLENFFSQVGKVKNIIMLRDKSTGHHKGFGYVEMADLEAIPNCLLFNNVVPDFQKFPILVKASEAEKNFLAKKDPFSNKYQGEDRVNDASGQDSRLYLGNIHVSIDEVALRLVLEQFGPVESIKIHKDHMGNSKGFAFIKYVSAESAALAMTTLSGQELAGRPLKVGPVIDQKAAMLAESGGYSGDLGAGASNNWKLDADEGAGGMGLNSSSRAMLMSKLAQAAGMEVPKPPPAPVAPMPMPVPSLAPVGGKPVIPPVGGVPSICLLICNMFDPATETEPNWDEDIRDDVKEECQMQGPVDHIYVEKNKPGGMVFVKFQTIDAATKAAHTLNGRFFAGRMITATFLEPSLYTELAR